MKKKIVVLIICLGIVMMLFVGCSGSPKYIKAEPGKSEYGIELMGVPKIELEESGVSDYLSVKISGMYQNNSEEDYTSVTLIFALHDKAGKQITTIHAFNKNGLAKGANGTFEAKDTYALKKDQKDGSTYQLKDISVGRATDPTREEMDQQMLEEAVQANFVEINAGNWELKKVCAVGKISHFDPDPVIFSFTFTTEENGGYGMYYVDGTPDLPRIKNVFYDLKDGDIVKIYGIVHGKNDAGMPNISVTIIEKVK